MTDRFVTVPDSLEIPADVKVPSARLSDSTAAGRALLDAADAAAQRAALGLGTAATTPATDYATAAQGAKADSASQPGHTHLASAISDSTPAGRSILTATDALPNPSAASVAIAVTYDTQPLGMDSQGRLLRCNGLALQRSTDDGATWDTIHTSGLRILAIRQMDNGELVASPADDGATHARKSRLYVSTGYPAGGGITFTQVLEADDYEQGFYLEWGWGGAGGVYVVSAYDTKPTNSRSGTQKVYLTTDYFATTPVAILDAGSGSVGNRHVHGAVYDQYRDAVWVTCGDGSSKALKVSFDARTAGAAATWVDVATNAQCTAIGVFPQCVVFGSDGPPNAVMRIDNPSPTSLVMTVAHRVDFGMSSSICAEAPYRRPGDGMPLLMPFTRITSGKPFVLITYDGLVWSEAWVDSRILGDTKGPKWAFGPTSGGKMLATGADAGGLFSVTVDLPAQGASSAIARAGRHRAVNEWRRTYARYGSATMVVPNGGGFTEWVVTPNPDQSENYSGLLTLAPGGKGCIVNRDAIITLTLDGGMDLFVSPTSKMTALMANGVPIYYTVGRALTYTQRFLAGTRLSCGVYQITGAQITADGSSRCMVFDCWEVSG